jgi:hypothetical protein
MLKKVVDFRNLSRGVFSDLDYILSDIDFPTVLYNDNEACLEWSYNMTSKAARYIELQENSIHERVQDKTLNICHIMGKVNPADNFTKEMRDGAYFCQLHDSFMYHLYEFLNNSLLAIHVQQSSPTWPLPAAARVTPSNGFSSYFTALASSSFCQTLTYLSHLCSASWHLLWELHCFVPSGLLQCACFFFEFEFQDSPRDSTQFFLLLDARMVFFGLSLFGLVERVEES